MKDQTMSDEFKPYANESDVIRIGDLEIENRVDRVTLTGDVVLTRDQTGLALAKELQALPEAVEEACPGGQESVCLSVYQFSNRSRRLGLGLGPGAGEALAVLAEAWSSRFWRTRLRRTGHGTGIMIRCNQTFAQA